MDLLTNCHIYYQNQNENGAAKLLKSVDTLSGALTKGLDETNTSAVTIVQSNIGKL